VKPGAITAEDLAGQVAQLLGIKYRDPRTARLLAKLLGGRESRTVAMLLGEGAPIAIRLWADRFTVSMSRPPRSDLRITIPLEDVMGLLVGRLPVRSLLRGKIRFWGSPALGARLGALLRVEIGDPQTAFGFFRHYFLDD